MTKLRVAELFAGVGGFRIGLEKTGKFEVVWSNQFEPSTKTQHASMVYEARFGKEGHSNEDIEKVETKDIPDFDVLVGGFPCQDYSVATTLKNSKGLLGKKGVLWWSINRILTEKKIKPPYIILENVDRLLKSPSSQRGRDFSVILKCLMDLDYAIEWRVINAAEYGFPQRRRRVFIIGYHCTTQQYKQLKKDPVSWLDNNGTFANAFPVKQIQSISNRSIKGQSIDYVSENFGKNDKLSFFENSGVAIDSVIHTSKLYPNFDGKFKTLGECLIGEEIPDEYYISSDDLDKWQYLKGAKKETRTSNLGYEYQYSEGGMIFPDDLNNASRTIITGEGGQSPSRFKHVISQKGRLRRLVPIELERLNGFPDNHTQLDGVSDTKRAFLMGNALVCGIVEKIGLSL
jgi:DNA (cytosine-5)-methyltransferase 1